MGPQTWFTSSCWGGTAAPGKALMANDRDSVLRKIKGLLAKASSSTFEAEAEACATKAEELMARYMIEQGEVAPCDRAAMVTKIMTVDGAYSDDRVRLLYVVATTNGVFAFKQGKELHMFGRADIIELVEATFTMLDTQLVGHIVKVGAGRRNVRAFRHSFIIGFNAAVAARLRQKVAQVKDETPGAGLVLASEAAAAKAFFKAENPGVRLVSRRTSTSSSAGFGAGGNAGSNADLGGARFNGRLAIGAGAR